MRFSSTSVKGMGLGRVIGFPTINLAIPKPLLLRYGVYGCRVMIQKQSFYSALYYGLKTIGGNAGITLEAHLLLRDANHALPPIPEGEKIYVTIDTYLRAPKKVSTTEELKKLLYNDVAFLTEKYWKKRGEDT